MTQNQSPTPPAAGGYARDRLVSTVGGKLADALGVVIAIKTLAPADYGVIGTALGLMAVIGFVNLSPEDVLWRDYPRLRDRLAGHLGAFAWFWRVKLGVVASIAALFAAGLGVARQDWSLAVAVFLVAVGLQAVTALTLVEVPLFAGLESRRGAVLVLGVRVLWLVLLVPNFWLRSLAYYVAALLLYSLVTVGLSRWQLRARWDVKSHGCARESWPVVRAVLWEFTLWLHLVGRSRIFLQRGFLAILGLAGVPLVTLGQTTVAVNLVGFAMILPGVLENVAAVRFAHDPARRTLQRFRLTMLAVLVAILQLVGGLLLGRWALPLLGVAEPETVYQSFVVLLAGASVLAMAGPAMAYAMCFRRMRVVSVHLFLPAIVLSALLMALMSVFAGVGAATVAAATVTGLTGMAIIFYVWRSTDQTREWPVAAVPESAFLE